MVNENSRDIGQISTELEFSLSGVPAERIVGYGGLSIVHEINPAHVVELNVSLANNISELNAMTTHQMKALISAVKENNGCLYGGSALIEETANLEPRRYRTTSLSESCARGFMDITSQQTVLGVNDEKLGFEIYNLFRKINPLLVAISASSPYKYARGKLVDTKNNSHRMEQYERLCSRFPFEMWRNMPEVNSMSEYQQILTNISKEVLRRLHANELDANWAELKKIRKNGKGESSYYPFTILEPHQIYWFVRIRPDHNNMDSGGKSLFSLEIRAPDTPTTINRINLMNSFVAGLSYYVADHGNIEVPLNGTFDELKEAGARGLESRFNGNNAVELIEGLAELSEKGLIERGYSSECSNFNVLEDILLKGNDADLIRRLSPGSPEELRRYLINRMLVGE